MVVWNVVLCDVCADRVVRRRATTRSPRPKQPNRWRCLMSGEGIIRVDYTREELIEICERAVVAHEHWSNRDSHHAHIGVGHAWALLKAGCEFRVLRGGAMPATDGNTIWVRFEFKDFNWFEWSDELGSELFYLPTPDRLDRADGKDWY